MMMKGKNVFHPIGWDSFGMPAENAAIKNNIPPAKWTAENIEHMKVTAQAARYSYDWDREVATYKPEYYRWNQWIFLKMLERGLVYKKRSSVNWCPRVSDCTLPTNRLKTASAGAATPRSSRRSLSSGSLQNYRLRRKAS